METVQPRILKQAADVNREMHDVGEVQTSLVEELASAHKLHEHMLSEKRAEHAAARTQVLLEHNAASSHAVAQHLRLEASTHSQLWSEHASWLREDFATLGETYRTMGRECWLHKNRIAALRSELATERAVRSELEEDVHYVKTQLAANGDQLCMSRGNEAFEELNQIAMRTQEGCILHAREVREEECCCTTLFEQKAELASSLQNSERLHACDQNWLLAAKASEAACWEELWRCEAECHRAAHKERVCSEVQETREELADRIQAVHRLTAELGEETGWRCSVMRALCPTRSASEALALDSDCEGIV